MSFFSLIQIDGVDAEKFLQGQLTIDMHTLQGNQLLLTGCCDNKGRLQANFFIGRYQKGFLLLVPTVTATILLQHLKKYGVFSKITVTVLNDISYLTSAEEKNFTEMNEYETRIFKPSNEHFSSLTFLIGKTRKPKVQKENDELHSYFIHQGIVFIYPETSGLFIPQMINFNQLDALSFTKGCYLGQEIIARTQHLGTLKRRLYRCDVETKMTLSPGIPVFNESQQSVGVLADFDLTNNSTHCLIILEDRALERNETLAFTTDTRLKNIKLVF